MKTTRRTNPLIGLLVLGIAAVLIARALGAVPDAVYDWIVRAAPALLIALGLGFLLRGRVPLGSLLALLVTAALAVGVGFVAYNQRLDTVQTANQQAISQRVGATSLLRVRVETLTTQIDVIDGQTAGLVSGEFIGSVDNSVNVTYSENPDGSGNLNVIESVVSTLPTLDTLGRGALNLALPPNVPIDLEVVGLNGATTLNLNGLSLERLNVTLTSGDLVVTLPDYAPSAVPEGQFNGSLTTGDGALALFIPASVSARLELNRGGSGIEPQYDATLYNYLVGDVIESRDIITAETVLRYSLTTPNGLIRVETSNQ